MNDWVTMQCCEQMQEQADRRCECHPRPEDCPDALIACSDIGQQPYGIWIHDGGSSFIAIKYCPWCGKKIRQRS